jgi:hypothetical protein
MKVGTIIRFIGDNEDPVKSPNTDMVMAWRTIGGKFHEPCNIERVEENGKQYCTWFIDDTEPVDVAGEKMHWKDFEKKWNSVEWCTEAGFHPIAVMRAFRDNARDGKRQAKDIAVGLRVRKGNQQIVVYANSPEWLKKELARFV